MKAAFNFTDSVERGVGSKASRSNETAEKKQIIVLTSKIDELEKEKAELQLEIKAKTAAASKIDELEKEKAELQLEIKAKTAAADMKNNSADFVLIEKERKVSY